MDQRIPHMIALWKAPHFLLSFLLTVGLGVSVGVMIIVTINECKNACYHGPGSTCFSWFTLYCCTYGSECDNTGYRSNYGDMKVVSPMETVVGQISF